MDQSHCVLLAGTDPGTLDALARVLEGNDPPVRVDRCTDAATALNMLRPGIDCAFVDANLPPDGGIALLRQIRSEGLHSPVVIFSSKPDEAVAEQAMEAGAVGFLWTERIIAPWVRQSLRRALRQRQAQDELATVAERLRAEQERLNRIVETIADGVLILDVAGQYIFANRAAEQILGTSTEKITGCNYRNPPWRREWVDGTPMSDDAHPYAQVMLTGHNVAPIELAIVRPDGRRIIIALSAAPLRNSAGQIEGIVATLRDVTESRAAAEALRKGQHFIQQIVNTSPDLIYIYDLVDRCNVYTNRQITEVLGYAPQQVRQYGSDLLTTLLHPDDVAAVAEHHRAMAGAKDDQIHEIEYRMKHADGEWRWLFSRDVAFSRSPDGTVRQIIGSSLDITDRRKAEESLKASEQRYRSMFETMLEGFGLYEAITDDAGRVIDVRYINVNPAFERLTGFKRSDVIGRRSSQVIPALEHEWFDAATAALHGAPAQFEGFVKQLGRWFDATVVSPGPGRLALFFQDITDRRRFEDALRESNEQLEAIISSSPLAVCAIDEQSRVTLWNPAAERVFGWTAQEVVGKPIPFVPPDRWQEHLAIRQRALERGPMTGLELHRQRKDGAFVDVSLSTAPVRDAAGNIICIVSVIEDVTESRRMKERLLQAHRMESIGRLAGGMAHEFNNLLAVISGYSESLLRRMSSDNSLAPHVREIEKAAERGTALTRQLLAFSRRPLAPAQVVDLNQTIKNVHRMLQHLLPEKIHTVIDVRARSATICADPGQMEQAVLNLALNARDAMPDGGTLTIATSQIELNTCAATTHHLRPGSYVRLIVSDTGLGMDEDVRLRVFEPFFTTKEGKGTGLGLSIVYEIVQQCGGDVAVRSEKGKGSTFELLLPQARRPERS